MSEFSRGRYQYPEDFRSGPFLMTFYLSFDTSRPPFDDARVRRAFAMGTDREQLINYVYEGRIFPATGGFLPPGMLGHAENIALPYDPSQASRLLKEAGYPEGKGFPEVEFLGTVGPYSVKFEETIKSQWGRNLGIKCKWQKLPWGEYLERLEQQTPHLWGLIGEFAEYPDPEAFGSIISQRTGWANDEYEELVNLARDTQDHEQRLRLYQQAERIVVEQVPVLPFAYSRFNALIKPWVRRFPLSPTRGWFWKEVVIEDH
jgi:oligopeptide transport system substrate-binding protein